MIDKVKNIVFHLIKYNDYVVLFNWVISFIMIENQ